MAFEAVASKVAAVPDSVAPLAGTSTLVMGAVVAAAGEATLTNPVIVSSKASSATTHTRPNTYRCFDSTPSRASFRIAILLTAYIWISHAAARIAPKVLNCTV